jgi:gliding motility-associatede transport system auxiliary component
MSNRLTFLLGVLGGVLAGAGVVVYVLAPERVALIATAEGLAAACLTVFFVAHFELFREFSTRRATRLGLNSVLMIVLLGLILGILNFLAARHSVRWDFSETKRFTLAPQTARLLRELPREVKVTVFTSDQSPVRPAYRDLIDSYQAHTAKLRAEFVDPEKRPGIARQYGITRQDTAVLESGKQETRITSASEQDLTNALIRVTKDEKKTAYFLTGHAEHSLEDGGREGYSFLKEALERQGYTVRSFSLYESKTIPTNASVIVLGGPQKPVSPEEQLLLADYVRTGGRLLVLLDPGSRAALDSTLAAWGLQADNRTVLDAQTILGGDLTIPVVNTYGSHEITQDLGQVFTMFPHTRPVSFLDSKSNAWAFHPLAKSSPRSWARAGTPPDRMTRARDFDPQKDTQGPLTLAALVVARASPAENARQPAVLLVGDSDFASNAFLDFSGNTDFILHAVAWLAEEKDLITIAPKDTRLGTLLLTAAQSNALFALQVLGLPGFFLLAGFAVWRRRRSL